VSTFDIGYVHGGMRLPDGEWMCNANCPHPAHSSIEAQFPNDHPTTCACHGDGIVCEDHNSRAWGECCGAAGMPCPHLHGYEDSAETGDG
jgi:hypothetical protein